MTNLWCYNLSLVLWPILGSMICSSGSMTNLMSYNQSFFISLIFGSVTNLWFYGLLHWFYGLLHWFYDQTSCWFYWLETITKTNCLIYPSMSPCARNAIRICNFEPDPMISSLIHASYPELIIKMCFRLSYIIVYFYRIALL